MGPILASLFVALAFIGTDTMGRKLVRKTAWCRRDSYFGIQMAMSTLSASMIVVANQFFGPVDHPLAGGPGFAWVFLVLSLMFFLFLLTVHQDWEDRTDEKDSRHQFWRLCVFSNVIGTGLFMVFVYMVVRNGGVL